MEITNYSHSQLVEFGTLTSQDIKRVNQCRRNYNKLGFAYQVIFVKLANYFPKQKPFEIITEVLTFASLQLNIDECQIISYKDRQQTISQHQEQIRNYLRLNRFDDQTIELLNTFLLKESSRIEQSGMLLVRAEKFLKDHRFLQPARDTLDRIIVTQRTKARQFIFEKIYSQLDEKMIASLDSIITLEGGKTSKLQQLKLPPDQASPKAMLALIRKLELIKEIKILEIEQSWLNNNYQRSLVKYCSRCSAHRLRQMKPSHRYAILACFLWQTNRDTIDYIIDMNFKLITKVYNHAQNEIDEEMRSQRRRIGTSLTMLKTISQLILDDMVPDGELWKKVFQKIPREILITQIDESESWLTGKYSHVFNLVIKRFNYLRQFSPAFFNHIHFQTEGNESSDLLKAIDILRNLNSNNKRKLPEDTPMGFVPVKLITLVAPYGNIDKQAWECALLTRVRDEIKAGNLSVKGSKRFCQFDDFFINDNEWIKIRSDFFKRANLPEQPSDVSAYLRTRLNSAYDTFLAKESENTYAKVKNKKWILSVDPASELTPEDELDLDNLKVG